MKITLNTSSKSFRTFFTLSIFLFAFLLLGSSVYSWSNPPSSPPNSNVAAPVNVSSSSQVKGGPLQVNGLLNVGSTRLNGSVGIGGVSSPAQALHVNGNVRANGFCIGTSCISSWPTGSTDNAWTTVGSNVYRAGGSVGIGVASPAQKLHVNGNVRANAFCIGTSCISSWPSDYSPSVRLSQRAVSGRPLEVVTSCNSNEIAVSGGGNCAGGDISVALTGPRGNGWVVRCNAAHSNNFTAVAYAMCLRR